MLTINNGSYTLITVDAAGSMMLAYSSVQFSDAPLFMLCLVMPKQASSTGVQCAGVSGVGEWCVQHTVDSGTPVSFNQECVSITLPTVATFCY